MTGIGLHSPHSAQLLTVEEVLTTVTRQTRTTNRRECVKTDGQIRKIGGQRVQVHDGAYGQQCERGEGGEGRGGGGREEEEEEEVLQK